jgi:hypothetical protein
MLCMPVLVGVKRVPSAEEQVVVADGAGGATSVSSYNP